MISSESYISKKKDMPWRMIEGEAILVDVDNSDVIYLNEVGASVYESIAESGNIAVKDIVDNVCSRFEVERTTAEEDILVFLEELSKKGVIGY